MLSYYHAVREVARRIARAIDHSVDAIREQRVEQEPAMTDRMLGAIAESLEGFRTQGIRWSAKTLTDRGRGAQEARDGADFVGVLNIELPDFKVSKGFLAQAKLIRNELVPDPEGLKRQCERMLNLTPDSFVFLYSQAGIRVVPAISVVGSGLDPAYLYSRSAQRFFEEHLQSLSFSSARSALPKTRSCASGCSRRSCSSFCTWTPPDRRPGSSIRAVPTRTGNVVFC